MKKISYIFLLLIVLSSCSKISVPDTYVSTDSLPNIYPDYTDIVIPANIAPMNFCMAEKPGVHVIVEIIGEKSGKILTESQSDGSVRFNPKEWKELLEANKGYDIVYTIYGLDNNKNWVKYKSFSNHIAIEPIDKYLSYRIIEPGYVAYNFLGIYQRDLETFEQKEIYTNDRNGHCINCHTYQNRKTDHMMFHVRENYGGTIIVNWIDNIEKLNTKAGPMYAACVYPSWHPTQNKIAFSTNSTGQFFYLLNTEKTEVVDLESNLVLYDVDKKEITPILSDSTCLETFPSWSPSGDRLYYSVCRSLVNNKVYNEDKMRGIATSFNEVFYDIWSIPYDSTTCTFGEAVPEYEPSLDNRSATLPRTSPDGKWLLFTVGNYGQFHIWHKNSDLYIKNLGNGEIHRLENANSEDVDSFHTWSSNGRWIVLSTRREDGSYTRPYFCYFDEQGNDFKAFALPQENPIQSKQLLKSYNLPEFMIEPVKVPKTTFQKYVYDTEATPVKYIIK